MDNLHRELAPISAAAWDQIAEEAGRTFRVRIAGRRVVDVPDAAGTGLSAVGTGHVVAVDSPASGVNARRRQVQPLVELRAPFTVTRAAIDDVERGAEDSDWQPVKDAAEQLATAEDRIVFAGAAGMTGIAPASSNPAVPLPDDVRELPTSVARALTALRMAGVEGPYALLLSSELYTAAAESVDQGYPVISHIERIMGDGQIVFAPALDGALLVTLRGGDYTLQLGQDVSIGYLSHDADTVTLYLQESLAFLVNTSEASVVIR
ncbi:family 1 encapsulin nanocompartment shell protein [Microbacterium luticocti]|uniref:family 1 encapsulin nanocompartment shell protein n=1 Tax=Microbacterium luticocti TaxID=451764 RepID=UPI00040C3142|nr:family 1 encapsulin nanocompartment shell protein [Microbacterium luticocti]